MGRIIPDNTKGILFLRVGNNSTMMSFRQNGENIGFAIIWSLMLVFTFAMRPELPSISLLVVLQRARALLIMITARYARPRASSTRLVWDSSTTLVVSGTRPGSWRSQ